MQNATTGLSLVSLCFQLLTLQASNLAQHHHKLCAIHLSVFMFWIICFVLCWESGMAAVSWDKSWLNKTANTTVLKSRNGVERIKNSFQWSNTILYATAPSLNINCYVAGMRKWDNSLAVNSWSFSVGTQRSYMVSLHTEMRFTLYHSDTFPCKLGV